MKYLYTFQREVEKISTEVERQYIEATSEAEARELLDSCGWDTYRVAQAPEYYGGTVEGFDYILNLIRVIPLDGRFKIFKNEKYL